MCLATATHNFRWVQNTQVYTISIKTYANVANVIFIFYDKFIF